MHSSSFSRTLGDHKWRSGDELFPPPTNRFLGNRWGYPVFPFLLFPRHLETRAKRAKGAVHGAEGFDLPDEDFLLRLLLGWTIVSWYQKDGGWFEGIPKGTPPIVHFPYIKTQPECLTEVDGLLKPWSPKTQLARMVLPVRQL